MKKSLIFALALMLVLAFATSAMAAQALSDGSYLSTTATGLDDYTTNTSAYTTFSRTYQVNKFNRDGITNYPYEIYLPNEMNPENYRIHSNYAKNTDACASCHATHTAVGPTLLQWYSVYETCMACHDGTLGASTYNVLAGKIGASSTPAFGGMFGVGGGSESNHNVTGSMDIAAAPGGSASPEIIGTGANAKTQWTVQFGCQSCHTPHANGGNARILHPDPNFAATEAAATKTNPNTYYVNPANGRVYADATYTSAPVYILKGYPYKYTISGTHYLTNNSGYSVVYDDAALTTLSSDAGVTISGGAIAALQVKMTIDHYLNAGGTETVEHNSGMNAYCGACHTDYNTAATDIPSQKLSGTYTQAHRHKVGSSVYLVTGSTNGYGNDLAKLKTYGLKFESDNLQCLTCHVAHGTSTQYWIDTLAGKASAEGTDTWDANNDNGEYTELAGSSALKRMPNMGTCEACHQKGASAEGYNANAGIVPDPTGRPAVTEANLMPITFNYSATTAEYGAANLGWVGSAKCLGCHEEYVEGWSTTGHALSGHNASGLNSGGCASCHNPGANLNYTNPIFQPTSEAVLDDAITCEACHGTGKNHIAAPSAKNIFNPGTKDIKRQVIECSRCHDMYKNNGTATEAVQFGNLAAKSGSDATIVSKLSTQAMYDKAGWSVAFRVYDSDPAKFANASQKNTKSTHFGGAWGYADSKHFLGTSTDASNPNGVVSCNTCHDMHSEKYAGGLKFEYQQVCASCHDSSANLAFPVAMPQNSWARHQLETVDYAHSFKFGEPAPIASATLTSVNIETTDAYGITPATESLTDRTGSKTLDLFQGPAGDRGGAFGFKLTVKDAGGNQLFNNYAGSYEIEYTPSGLGAAVEGVDYELTETGCVEFSNIAGTLAEGGTFDTGKLTGTYTVTWTSAANPAITATDSFQITH